MQYTEDTLKLFNKIKNTLKNLPYEIENLEDAQAISKIKEFDYSTYAKLHILMEKISESHNEAENIFTVQDENGRNLGMLFALSGLENLAYLCMVDKTAAIQLDIYNNNIAMYCARSIVKMPKAIKFAMQNPIAATQHNVMGFTFPMHAIYNDYDIMDECLQSADILKQTDNNKLNFLMHCSGKGDVKTIGKFLDKLEILRHTQLEEHKKFHDILLMQNEFGENLAMICIKNKQFQIAHRMLSDAEIALQQDFLGRIPGMYCAIYGDEEGTILSMQNKNVCLMQDKLKNNIALYTVMREEPLLKAASYAEKNHAAIEMKNKKNQSFLSIVKDKNIKLPKVKSEFCSAVGRAV